MPSYLIRTSAGLAPANTRIKAASGLVALKGSAAPPPGGGPTGGGGGGSTGGGGTGGVNSLSAVLAAMQTAGEDQPHGMSSFASWYYGPEDDNATPPSGYSACTFWGQIYMGSGGPGSDTNTRVQIRMVELYVHSRSTNKWTVAMQGNSASTLNGNQFDENFYNNLSVPASTRDESSNGGGLSILMSKATTSTPSGTVGYNYHFYGMNRNNIPITPSDVDAAFSTAQVRLILNNPSGTDDRANSNYIANIGGDWWQNLTAAFPNNNQIYEGQFRKIPKDGSWLPINAWSGPTGFTPSWPNSSRYSSGLSLAAFQSSPPPLNAMGT